MSDINKKLDDILNILSENNKKFEKQIKDIDEKLEYKINNINSRIDILEQSQKLNINKNLNLLSENKEKDNNFERNDNIIRSKNNNLILDQIDKSSDNIRVNENKNKKKILKRGKYLKTNNKSEFLKNIHYLEIDKRRKKNMEICSFTI